MNVGPLHTSSGAVPTAAELAELLDARGVLIFALNDQDLEEFVQLQASKPNGPKSWTLDVQQLGDTCDLSVKNPNKQEDNTLRPPQEILEEMKALDEESTEILNSILKLI